MAPRGPNQRLVRLSDGEAKRLARFYADAEREILAELNRALLKGNKTEYLKVMLQNVQVILDDLRSGSRTWCEEAIPRIYVEGAMSADMQLEQTGAKLVGGFGAIHQQAAQVLAENAYNRFNDVAQFIGRRTDDLYRTLALENVRGSVVGYESWQRVARQYREQLADSGITGFKDAKGHNWNLRSYAEMVSRTTTMEAHLEGTKNRLLEHGHDLVIISSHYNPCDKCKPWEGKVLSLTGKTEGYPTLDEAKAAGLFHPNCRHAYGLHLDLGKETAKVTETTDVQEEKPDYYTEVQGIDEAARKGLAEAFTKAISFGLKNKRECLLTIDANNGREVYSMVEGGNDYVEFPQELTDFLNQASVNSLISIHNHPSSSSFSAEDLTVLTTFDSLKSLTVIGHDGTRYIMSRGSGQKPSRSTIRDTLNTMVKKYYNQFNSLVQSGKMAPSEAWKEHSHLAVSDLAKEFGWDYRRVMPNEQ